MLLSDVARGGTLVCPRSAMDWRQTRFYAERGASPAGGAGLTPSSAAALLPRRVTAAWSGLCPPEPPFSAPLNSVLLMAGAIYPRLATCNLTLAPVDLCQYSRITRQLGILGNESSWAVSQLLNQARSSVRERRGGIPLFRRLGHRGHASGHTAFPAHSYPRFPFPPTTRAQMLLACADVPHLQIFGSIAECCMRFGGDVLCFAGDAGA